MKSLWTISFALFWIGLHSLLLVVATQGWILTSNSLSKPCNSLRFALGSSPHPSHATSALYQSPSLAELLEEQLNGDNSSNEIKAKPLELWLDLRDTAMRPREALLFLQEFLFDNEDNEGIKNVINGEEEQESASETQIQKLVDQVLVSEETFASMVKSENRLVGQVLYAPKDGQIAEHCQDTQQSLVKGKLLSPTMDNGMMLLDPLAAMDAVQDGGWILLDADATMVLEHNVAHYVDQVEGLLQILSCAGSGDSDTLLLSPSSTPTTAVAIVCPSVEAFLAMDRCLATQNLASAGAHQTESGIWLTSATDINRQSPADNGLTAAFVLPLDLRLWQTAWELQQQKTD